MSRILAAFNQFLLWLEEHQIGILTTIAIHLLIITFILILKIRSTVDDREYTIMLDLSQIQAMMEKEIPDEQPQQQMSSQEYVQTLNQEYNMRNIPVNTAEARAVENIEKMVRDIKTEMNIADLPPEDTPAEIVPKEEKAPENETRTYDDKYPLNEAGERTIYKGTTTVSYELSGRHHTSMPAPVYKCRSGGKIVVDITVNGNGYVLEAKINKSKSELEDPICIEAARRDAERSRFDTAPQAKQQGSITYIFQAQ